jgi:uncharacterized protein (TIGR02996 family)
MAKKSQKRGPAFPFSCPEELRQGVLDAPVELGPRLVLADWLLEQGGEAADVGTFINAQCEMQRRIEEGSDWGPDYLTLVEQQAERLDKQQRDWKPIFKGLAYHFWFERGFPQRVSMRLTALEDRLPQLISRTPLRGVRFLRFRDQLEPSHFRQAGRSALLAKLDGLELPNLAEPSAFLSALLEEGSRALGLKTLSLAENQLGDDDLVFLCSRPWQRLTHLDLQGTLASEEQLALVLKSPLGQKLEWLGFGYIAHTDVTAQLIAATPNLTRLDILSFTGLTDEGLTALSHAKHLRSLRTLFIWGSQVSDAGLKALVRSEARSNLQILTICPDPDRPKDLPVIGDEGISALAQGRLPRLDFLNLENNQISDAGAEALRQSEHLGSLRELSLKKNPISDACKKSCVPTTAKASAASVSRASQSHVSLCRQDHSDRQPSFRKKRSGSAFRPFFISIVSVTYA